METQRNIARSGRIAVCAMIVIAMSATIGFADVIAKITKKKQFGGQTYIGNTRYLAASKMYKMEIPRKPSGFIKVSVPLAEVARIQVKEPKELAGIKAKITRKQYTGLEAKLQKIRKDYNMLEWDIEAARLLAEVYVNTGNARKAVSMCKAVMKANPNATQSAEFFRIYARALVETGSNATLEKLLKEVIVSGGRPAAAEAQILRGDMLMKKGDYKLALIDGYLRNIVLFSEIRGSRPEALSKAVKCFEQLGENNNAEMMRKLLKREFPNYAASE